MPSYAWTQDRTNSEYTLGNPPMWWTLSGDPVLVATVPSPSGPGDVLVRTELWAEASGFLEGNVGVPSIESSLYWISMRLMGEVYSAGSGGFPDPNALGAAPAVVTAGMSRRVMSFNHPTSPDSGGIAWDTNGIVTSRGERGPAKYGAGHPELRVGLYADHVLDPFLPGAMNSAWGIWVRCLWRTP